MKIPHLRRMAPLTLIASCLALAPRAQAITIDFGTDQGYSTTGGQIDSGETVADGNLAGQPSASGTAQWAASTSANNDSIDVVANTITGSGQMIQLSPTTTQPYYSYTPTSTDLGGTFSNTSSDLTFSLSLAIPTTINGLVRITFGSESNFALQLEVQSTGVIDYKSGSTEYYVTTDGTTPTSSGASDDLKLNGSFNTVSGSLNYATDTFTLTADGHTTTSEAFTSGFSGDTAGLQVRDLLSTGGNLDIDSVSVSVPEPCTASLAMLGGGMFVLFWIVRRRNSRTAIQAV